MREELELAQPCEHCGEGISQKRCNQCGMKVCARCYWVHGCPGVADSYRDTMRWRRDPVTGKRYLSGARTTQRKAGGDA